VDAGPRRSTKLAIPPSSNSLSLTSRCSIEMNGRIELVCLVALVYHSDRQALSTPRVCCAGQLAIADTCLHLWCRHGHGRVKTARCSQHNDIYGLTVRISVTVGRHGIFHHLLPHRPYPVSHHTMLSEGKSCRGRNSARATRVSTTVLWVTLHYIIFVAAQVTETARFTIAIDRDSHKIISK